MWRGVHTQPGFGCRAAASPTTGAGCGVAAGEAMVAASGGAFAAWELGLYLWGRTAKEDAMKLKPRHAVRAPPSCTSGTGLFSTFRSMVQQFLSQPLRTIVDGSTKASSHTSTRQSGGRGGEQEASIFDP